MTGSRMSLTGSLSLQIAIAPSGKASRKKGGGDCGDGGGGNGGGRANSSTLDAAVRILRGAFAPLRTDDGVDLVTAVCRGMSSSSSASGDGEEDGDEGGKKKKKRNGKKKKKKDDDDDDNGGDGGDDDGPSSPSSSSSTLSDYDFEGFAVALLRDGPTPVAAAAFRPRGPAFAELPYLATSASHRRRGLARRLLASLEALLTSRLGVRNVVVPAALPLASAMWEHAFGYSRVSLARSLPYE